jgi:transcriptional regulator with XRE-family HTH domain
MAERVEWTELRERRLSEPGAAEAYEAARLAFELGRAVREIREARGWSQRELIKRDSTVRALVIAMPEVFPWVRHLSEGELCAFTLELVDALSDEAELDVDVTTQEVIAGWRATVRIKADPAQYAEARRPTSGDFGPVQVTA